MHGQTALPGLLQLRTATGLTAVAGQPIAAMATPGAASPGSAAGLARGQTLSNIFAVTVADDAPISTKPYFSRAAFTENRYTLADKSAYGRPFGPAPLVASAKYTVNNVEVEMTEVVKRREANVPYGNVTREVRTVPRIGISVFRCGERDSGPFQSCPGYPEPGPKSRTWMPAATSASSARSRPSDS